jgi:hypothetical protein
MARARNIKPALFKNELLGVADPLLTLLFLSLWTLADKEGRLEDRPLRIKAETFPYRDGLDVNGYLTELQRLGFIVRYLVGDLALIQVVNFKKHQTPHNTEKPSTLPPVESGTLAGCALQGAFVKSPLSNSENIDALPPDSLVLIPDSLLLIPDTGAPAKQARFDPRGLPMPIGLKAATWGEWVSFRSKLPKPPKPETWEKQVEFLAQQIANGADADAIIDYSIRNGYTGLFEPRQTQPKTQFLTAQQQRDENNRRSTAEFLADDSPFFGQHMESIEGEFTNA